MTNNDQAAQNTSVASAKDAWVKPEITSFVGADEALAVAIANPTDGGGAGANIS